MDDSREYFEGRAAQCRRLAASMGDARTVDILTTAAIEFEAKAKAAAGLQPEPPTPEVA
jgi:hypothetical protein